MRCRKVISWRFDLVATGQTGRPQMIVKARIVEQLGEGTLLLPARVRAALAANDRAKVRMSALQAAAAFVAGWLSDLYGRRTMTLSITGTLVVTPFLTFPGLNTGSPVIITMILIFGCVFAAQGVTGVHMCFWFRAHTELTKFRPFRNVVSEGKPDRASAGQAVTLMKFGRVRIFRAEYQSWSRTRSLAAAGVLRDRQDLAAEWHRGRESLRTRVDRARRQHPRFRGHEPGDARRGSNGARDPVGAIGDRAGLAAPDRRDPAGRARMREQAEAGAFTLEEDLLFHLKIAEATRNNLLRSLIALLGPDVLRFCHLHATYRDGRMHEAANEHDLIVEAIESRSPVEAERLMNDHLGHSYRQFHREQTSGQDDSRHSEKPPGREARSKR
jgi:hypothetical protein